MIAGLVQAGIFISILVLIFLAQRFWFRSLWKVSDSLAPSWRKVVRGLAIAALCLLIFTIAERILGLGLLRRTRIAGVTFALMQLWVLSSSMAYLFYKCVRLVEHLWFGIKDAIVRKRPEPTHDHARRAFFGYAARLAAAIPLIAGIYGYTSERFHYQVRRVDVPITDLPPALNGFQILQISDIHIGDFMPRYEVARAIDMANQLGAHVAFVTGDFITGHNDPLEDCIAEIALLRTPLGVWGCNGNHEIYAEAEDKAQLLFQKHGMRLLRQERAELDWNGAKLNLIGVDYQRDHMVRGPKPPMLSDVEPLIRRDMPNILLSHNPNSFYKAAELGIELSLAGHTHGGQVNVEILDEDVNPSRFITKFIAGLYQLPAGTASNSSGQTGKRFASLYVNRGLGTIGLPARLGVDPEITLLTLRPA